MKEQVWILSELLRSYNINHQESTGHSRYMIITVREKSLQPGNVKLDFATGAFDSCLEQLIGPMQKSQEVRKLPRWNPNEAPLR